VLPATAAALALAAVLVLSAPGTAGATGCRFSDGVARARVDGGTALRMFVWPAGSPDAGRLWWGNQSDSSQDGWCGRATVRNTDRVVVSGKGRSGRLDYQLPHRPFAPGRTAEAGSSEIEFVLRGGMDGFWMTGLGGLDGEAESVRVGDRGVDVNGDGDVDVRFRSRVTNLYLFLLGGDDTADGRGGHGTGGPWPRGRPLSLIGGDGADVLHGRQGPDALQGDPGADWLHGHGGKDYLVDHDDDHLLGGPGDDVLTSTGGASWLLGGAGDDVLDAADLIADEVLDGGPGDDQAWHDEEDQPAGIEARLFR
jgi:Ca2+-binding RTX toxin-like protein